MKGTLKPSPMPMDIEYEITMPLSLCWQGSCFCVRLHIHKREGEPFMTVQIEPLLN